MQSTKKRAADLSVEDRKREKMKVKTERQLQLERERHEHRVERLPSMIDWFVGFRDRQLRALDDKHLPACHRAMVMLKAERRQVEPVQPVVQDAQSDRFFAAFRGLAAAHSAMDDVFYPDKQLQQVTYLEQLLLDMRRLVADFQVPEVPNEWKNIAVDTDPEVVSAIYSKLKMIETDLQYFELPDSVREMRYGDYSV